MKSRRIAWAVVVTLAVSIAGGVWLLAQPKTAIGTFGSIAANPAYVIVNTATPVVFTAQITDPQLKKRSVVLVRLDGTGQPSDVVGRLRDDGRNGDVVAGDRTYTLRTSLNEPVAGEVNFKIAARFKPGKWAEPEEDDDDWEQELAQPGDGRDRPAEKLIGEKRLRKLRRYAMSESISVSVWKSATIADSPITGSIPPRFVQLNNVSAAISKSSFFENQVDADNNEVALFSVVVDRASGVQSLDEYVSYYSGDAASATAVNVGQNTYVRWQEDLGDGLVAVSFSAIVSPGVIVTVSTRSSAFAVGNELQGILSSLQF